MASASLGTDSPSELQVRISPMRRRHLRSVLRIESQVCPRPWTLPLYLAELGAASGRRYVVARTATSVVGYGGLMVAAGEGHVTTLAVDPACQRRAVGSQVLHALASWGRDQGCTGLTLEVRMGNLAAQSLYRRFGFVPAGVRRGYYAETNEDALIMWAHGVDRPAYAERLRSIAEHLGIDAGTDPAPGEGGP
ncbi:MAG TPA: ribosomal protein S18-alanine N-acetyltransferase [Acidimicrobiales bacterium]|nr:ribosomal protein S18-alanine N-acetyltransferase [Acidimicrobiales bacterium]